MIVHMCRIRLLGPRERLADTLRVTQDFGRVQVDRVPSAGGMAPILPEPRADREQRYVARLLDDATAALAALPSRPAMARGKERCVYDRASLGVRARRTRRTRREAERLRTERQALTDEQAVLARYRDFLDAFREALASLRGAPHLRAYGVTLPAAEQERVDQLGDTLRRELGMEVMISSKPLAGGDLAVLVAVPTSANAPMEAALSSAKIAEVPLPEGYSEQSLTQAAPKILARLTEIPAAADRLEEAQRALAERSGPGLLALQAMAQDRLAALAAENKAVATAHVFAVEGWLPERDIEAFRQVVARNMGSDVALEMIAREQWTADTGEAPVVLSNPRIFQPFEVLTSLMPLPRYGSIDPTPFVAIGFPMMFGIILGDVGYGLVLGGIGLAIVRRNLPGSLWRKTGEIAIACGAFTVIFGALFGEFFGALGQQWFGMKPILFDREVAIVSAMVLAVSIGVVHTMLGVVLGFLQAVRSSRRLAVSRATQLVMLALIVVALLSAVHVLPSRLLGPFGVAALIGFPALLLLEGLVAPIEFLSTLSSMLSYLRIMALGTASVILASIANRMVGLTGSVLVGVLFALLFHLVNFALGIFSPTVHALRLHYVEFFRTFFTPGGRPYQPLTHHTPSWRGHT
jgi:V/A-type H+/Na+-transporting ATPase subunit I